ncbi:hypothetical protein HYPSUDRAFT_213206 [Hypholoma sublateritium FD-334 SS-4]|uniref:Uncharacterized protein n=1 Tax=Hypholoma sublateritium (strain FD-334 SS-4) TaxID=945553 RepID=A0A0D2Q525_HYPSF|nr:hypothetical protein HYPSUDRAFT_213206 [Hypholoma sublateritium FD-334 SS-4]
MSMDSHHAMYRRSRVAQQRPRRARRLPSRRLQAGVFRRADASCLRSERCAFLARNGYSDAPRSTDVCPTEMRGQGPGIPAVLSQAQHNGEVSISGLWTRSATDDALRPYTSRQRPPVCGFGEYSPVDSLRKYVRTYSRPLPRPTTPARAKHRPSSTPEPWRVQLPPR